MLGGLAASLFCWAILPKVRYQSIVVHHTAGQVGDLESIRRQHYARGWFETAYHLVLSNGSTAVPLGHLQPTLRYRLGLWSVATRNPRANTTALHLCIVGNYEAGPLPERLEGPVGHAVRMLQRKHRIPNDKILLHRDCSQTACPGKNVTRERVVHWAQKAPSCPPEIRAQHRRTLGGKPLG